ncbi:Lipoprotein lipase [Halotydeus destructor]|nr:Lipoprotein lipase [Halotydeus destructor]
MKQTRRCNEYDMDIGQQCVDDQDGAFCDGSAGCLRHLICFAPDNANDITVYITLFNRKYKQGLKFHWRHGRHLKRGRYMIAGSRTFLAIHGYGANPIFQDDLEEVVQNLLIAFPTANVLLIDWSQANKTLLKLLANYRLAATMVGHFLLSAAILKRITCIGHSQGSHICALASNHLREKVKTQFSLIVGLDTGGPFSQHCPLATKLDKMDADYVMIWHTNSNNNVNAIVDNSLASILHVNLGNPENLGHVDVHFSTFPRNMGLPPFWGPCGMYQPSCLRPGRKVEGLWGPHGLFESEPQDILGPELCSHQRVLNYFANSLVTNCFKIARVVTVQEFEPSSLFCTGQTRGPQYTLPGIEHRNSIPEGVYFIQPSANAKEKYCPNR